MGNADYIWEQIGVWFAVLLMVYWIVAIGWAVWKERTWLLLAKN